jgi:signal transduction histidine kinase
VVAYLALFIGYAWFTRALVGDIREDTERLATLYARALRVTSAEDAQLLLFEEVIQSFPYPVILTDELGNPTAFKNLDLDIANQTGPWSPADRLALRQEAARMDRIADPYPVLDESGAVIQRIHVAEAGTITLLRYLPYIQALGLAAIGLIAFWLIRYNLRVQRGQIWVAMARESAHQMGTPLSSLYGWIELLRARAETGAGVAAGGHAERPPGGDSLAGAGAAEVAEAMEQDLNRLTKVANRFELIGRRPKLVPLDLGEVLRDLARYFEARLPRLGHRVELTLEMDAVPAVLGNRVLLEWAFENLIKNSVDALKGKAGRIQIEVDHDPGSREIEVFVRDDGAGIPRALRKRIFKPGVTTKTAGWGVGLALARRILQDYHGGRLELVESEVGKGTTFRALLPVPEKQPAENA